MPRSKKLLDLCAGIGGFSLAAHWLGWQTEAFCERDKFCQKVLTKNFPGVPIYDDVFTFPSESFRGRIDVLTAGFPCQPFSAAGKRKGRDDERHIFPQIMDIVGKVQPTWCVFENVRGLLSIESGQVYAEIIASLESEGFEVITHCIPASALNAPHRRDRLWIVALNTVNREYRADRRTQGEANGLSTVDRPSGCSGRISGAVGDVNSYTNRLARQSQQDIEPTTRIEASQRHNIGRFNAPHPNSFGERAGLGEVQGTNGEVPEWHDDAESSNADLCVATDARCEYGQSRGNGGLAANPPEWSHGEFDAERCGDAFTDTLNAFGVAWNSKGSGLTSGVNGSRQEQYGRTSSASTGWGEYWPTVATRLCGVSYGLSDELHVVGSRDNRVNRLKALGNSIVPQIAFELFKAIDEADKNFRLFV